MRKVQVDGSEYWWASRKEDFLGWHVTHVEISPPPMRGMPTEAAVVHVESRINEHQTLKRTVYCSNDTAKGAKPTKGAINGK